MRLATAIMVVKEIAIMDWYERYVRLEHLKWIVERSRRSGKLSDQKAEEITEALEVIRKKVCPEPPPLTAKFF